MDEFQKLFDLKLLIAIALIFIVGAQVKLKKKRRRKKIRMLKDNEEDIVMDLEFNNKEKNDNIVFNQVMTFFNTFVVVGVSVFIYVLLLLLEVEHVPKFQSKTAMILVASIFFVMFSYLYDKRKKIFKRLARYQKQFKFHDLIFTKTELKINPFIVGDPKLNPSLKTDILEIEDQLDEIEFVTVKWKDIKSIEINEKDVKHHMIYYYLIDAGEEEIYLDRLNFKRRDEEEFLSLMQDFSQAKIENNSKYKRVPLKAPKFHPVNTIISLTLIVALFYLIYKTIFVFTTKLGL